MVGWALLTTEADCTATVSEAKVSSAKTGCRSFSTSRKTSSGGGTALILWALPWLAYFSTTGMLSSLKVLNLRSEVPTVDGGSRSAWLACGYEGVI